MPGGRRYPRGGDARGAAMPREAAVADGAGAGEGPGRGPPRRGRARLGLRFNLRLRRDYGCRIVSNPRHRPPGAARPSPQQRRRRRGGQVNPPRLPSCTDPPTPLFAFSRGKLRGRRLPGACTPRLPLVPPVAPILTPPLDPSPFALRPVPLSARRPSHSPPPLLPPPPRPPPGAGRAPRAAQRAGSGAPAALAGGSAPGPFALLFSCHFPLQLLKPSHGRANPARAVGRQSPASPPSLPGKAPASASLPALLIITIPQPPNPLFFPFFFFFRFNF